MRYAIVNTGGRNETIEAYADNFQTALEKVAVLYSAYGEFPDYQLYIKEEVNEQQQD